MAKLKENPLAVKSGDIFIEKSAPVHCSAQSLAEEIATEILTIYGSNAQFPSVECTRAQLMLRNDIGEFNMGGRNKASIIEVIVRHLKRVGF